MIHEPRTDMHYAICVDGYLPPAKTLSKVLSEKGKQLYEAHQSDTTLMEEFDHIMGTQYHVLGNGQSSQSAAFVHLLRTCFSHSLPGTFNPIRDEVHECGSRDQDKNYRLFVMVQNTDNENESGLHLRKRAFLNTIDELSMSIKPEESYRDIESVRRYLTELSHFFIHRHFFPFQSIRDEVRKLGFDSKESIV